MTTLRQDIELASRRCEAVFAADGNILNIYEVVLANGERGIIADPGNAAAAMRQIFAELDVVRYVRVGEAWTLESPVPEKQLDEIYANGKGIVDHPNRREIVTIIGEDRDEGQILAMRDIIRSAIGPAVLGPLHIQSCVEAQGRLVGMLPPKGKAS